VNLSIAKLKRNSIDFLCPIVGVPQYEITSSREYKYTWFRVAKTGTRTLLSILLKESNPDINGLRYPYFRQYHKSHFKFTMIRNPWDRIVSCYKEKVLEKNMFPDCWGKDFEYFVKYISAQNLDNCDEHIIRQIKLFPLNDIDYIGRFENFNSDYNFIFNQRLGFKSELVHRNKSINRTHYTEFYTNVSRRIISEIYREDIEVGGYVFGL